MKTSDLILFTKSLSKLPIIKNPWILLDWFLNNVIRTLEDKLIGQDIILKLLEVKGT